MNELLMNKGVQAFTIVKGIGYALFLVLFFKQNSGVKAISAALLRLCLGILLGGLILESGILGTKTLVFYGALMALRILEWNLVFRVFYPFELRARPVTLVASATLFSTLLDAFALFGMFKMSGFIC